MSFAEKLDLRGLVFEGETQNALEFSVAFDPSILLQLDLTDFSLRSNSEHAQLMVSLFDELGPVSSMDDALDRVIQLQELMKPPKPANATLDDWGDQRDAPIVIDDSSPIVIDDGWLSARSVREDSFPVLVFLPSIFFPSLRVPPRTQTLSLLHQCR